MPTVGTWRTPRQLFRLDVICAVDDEQIHIKGSVSARERSNPRASWEIVRVGQIPEALLEVTDFAVPFDRDVCERLCLVWRCYVPGSLDSPPRWVLDLVEQFVSPESRRASVEH